MIWGWLFSIAVAVWTVVIFWITLVPASFPRTVFRAPPSTVNVQAKPVQVQPIEMPPPLPPPDLLPPTLPALPPVKPPARNR